MKPGSMLAATTIPRPPLVAVAQPLSGLYVGGGAGVNIMQDENATVNDLGFGNVRSRHLKAEVGAAFAVSAGYGLGNGLRGGIEGSYRYNTFGKRFHTTPRDRAWAAGTSRNTA